VRDVTTTYTGRVYRTPSEFFQHNARSTQNNRDGRCLFCGQTVKANTGRLVRAAGAVRIAHLPVVGVCPAAGDVVR